ncbi:MAG: hypothetical protein JWO05_2910 [Gemmatimonadetes bacterium]|nr:hypothetical protein [Gemmatimonadota bacterium]
MRRWLLALAVVASVVSGSQAAWAQTATLQFVNAPFFPFPVAPEMVALTQGFSESDGPLTLRVEIARDQQFAGVVYREDHLGQSSSFKVQRLLPPNTTLFVRLTVIDNRSVTRVQQVYGPVTTPAWLTLISPEGVNNITVDSRRPTFNWSSARVSTPPGPWTYDFSVVNVATQQVELLAPGLIDTVFTSPLDLAANTSYRWAVTARVANGSPADSARVISSSTFVILSSDAPRATLIYQNFPNPFPNAVTGVTCIWFDLRVESDVQLEVRDLRGSLVKTLVPGALPARLPSGIYGRGSGGCDSRLQWDGTDGSGRTVAPGVYLLRFRAGGVNTFKKMLFVGK